MKNFKLINDRSFNRAEFETIFQNSPNFERYELVNHLNTVQDFYGYLSRNSLESLSLKMNLSLNEIIGVASFYSRFRFEPGGRYTIEVCVGTACHVKGAENLYNEFYKLLNLDENRSTSEDGLFSLEKVACLGCCMMAPAVKIEDSLFGPVEISDCEDILTSFLKSSGSVKSSVEIGKGRTQFLLCDCSSCRAAGAGEVLSELKDILSSGIWDGDIKRTACTGNSEASPRLEIKRSNQDTHFYYRVRADQVKSLVRQYAPVKKVRGHLYRLYSRVEDFILGNDKLSSCFCEGAGEELRLATEGAGTLDPLNLDEYRKEGGFEALDRISRQSSEDILGILLKSGLRGRGGGGYSTAEKWKALLAHRHEKPYVICNADEGDPGAFMDRMLLESFPFRIVEGLMIAALTFHARKVIIYVRCEYPLAINRVGEALRILKKNHIIGENARIPQLSIDFEIVEGAGAFVCGEETALLNSLEGKRGIPRPRPPYPSESGYLDHPTLVNNVETFSLLPWLCREGADAFKALGTEKSSGTKTFALAGKIRCGGLIEVNLGITISRIINEYGDGMADGSVLKAVQIGGPSGGCLPASMADLPVDYEALKNTGAIMGSGGLVVLDQHDCLVDLSRYFLDFCRKESCGRCLWCRSGTETMYRILDRICCGDGNKEDLAELKRLALLCREFSQCGLGQSAPNPLLTSLEYFYDEYTAHLQGHCPAGVCKDLITYTIDGDCIGCGLCSKACADKAVSGELWHYHSIDQDLCTKCGNCFNSCPEGAISVR